MMGWYGGGTGVLGWFAMVGFSLLLLGLIVWLVVRLLPATSGGASRPVGEPPLEILDRRLANGEIDLGTWQAQRAALLAARHDKI